MSFPFRKKKKSFKSSSFGALVDEDNQPEPPSTNNHNTNINTHNRSNTMGANLETKKKKKKNVIAKFFSKKKKTPQLASTSLLEDQSRRTHHSDDEHDVGAIDNTTSQVRYEMERDVSTPVPLPPVEPKLPRLPRLPPVAPGAPVRVVRSPSPVSGRLPLPPPTSRTHARAGRADMSVTSTIASVDEEFMTDYHHTHAAANNDRTIPVQRKVASNVAKLRQLGRLHHPREDESEMSAPDDEYNAMHGQADHYPANLTNLVDDSTTLSGSTYRDSIHNEGARGGLILPPPPSREPREPPLSSAARNAADYAKFVLHGDPKPTSSNLNSVKSREETVVAEIEDSISGRYEEPESPHYHESAPRRAALESSQQQQTRHLVLTRHALSRPFGRHALPPTAQRWTVRVDPPRWSARESRWNYRISIIEETSMQADTRGRDAPSVALTTATTTRSLQDFAWLEQALLEEFQGGVLIPLLSLRIHHAENNQPADLGETTSGSWDMETKPTKKVVLSKVLDDKMDTNEQVECQVLSDWLSDLINGVRGQGEIVVHYHSVDMLIGSEAMETFLYRNTNPLPSPRRGRSKSPTSYPSQSPTSSSRQSSLNDSFFSGGSGANSPDSILKSLVARPFACFAVPNMNAESVAGVERLNANAADILLNCSPRAFGVGGNNHNDFGVLENRDLDMRTLFRTPILAVPPLQQQLQGRHSANGGSAAQFVDSVEAASSIQEEVIDAQHYVVSCYGQAALHAGDAVQTLLRVEAEQGAFWKRFAIAISNLFSYEKEVESAKVGSTKGENDASNDKGGFHNGINKDKQTKTKSMLSKTAIDDGLRVLAKQKVDRTVPSLRDLEDMMNAYASDLCMVPMSFEAFQIASSQLAQWDTNPNNKTSLSHPERRGDDRSESVRQQADETLKQLKAIASQKLVIVKKQLTGGSGKSFHTASTTANTFTNSANNSFDESSSVRRRTFGTRVVTNEALLRASLTNLCKSNPIRMARCSWKFFKMEAQQASLLSSSSLSLRSKVSTPALIQHSIAMASNHARQQKEDEAVELRLVSDILTLGEHTNASPSFENNGHDDEEAMDRAELCHRAKLLARDRVGRWDSKLALAIMEAAGIEDAEVRVEETTRELRLVRKLAIGLRGCVERCVEASEELISSNFRQGSESMGMNPRDARVDFLSTTSAVFSGSLVGSRKKTSNEYVERVLEKVGIDLFDSAGWIDRNKANGGFFVEGNCGKIASTYYKIRELDLSVFLEKISKLLHDYIRRVEGIESLVYMHCVGIQLEKHFSKIRSHSLAAWERKTDITTAINIATRKRLPLLVSELQAKLESLSSSVSHTTVKQAKERHLKSKSLKSDLHSLANRRFQRAKEAGTDKVAAIIRLWAQYEETVACEELKALGEVIREIERNVREGDIEADGGAHLFASRGARPRIPH